MDVARRIQRNPGTLVVVGLALIAVALALIWLNLSSRGKQHPVPQTAATADDRATVDVLVATRNVTRGQVLSVDDIGVRRMEGTAPTGSYSDRGPIVGRVATTDIRASQIIFSDNLSAIPAGAGIAALVPEGQRAFSIRVAEEDIVGGFLQAGDHVDVFVTLPGAVYGGPGAGQPKDDQSKSTLLLQDMQVLAVGPELSPRDGAAQGTARTVTLAAAPGALARLALAGRLGQITLAIRNPGDREVAPAEVVALEDLRPGAAPVAERQGDEKSSAPAGHRVTIHSGRNQTTVTTSR